MPYFMWCRRGQKCFQEIGGNRQQKNKENKKIFHKYFIYSQRDIQQISGWLKHPLLWHSSIDIHLKSWYSKFQLAMILRYWGMHDNMERLLLQKSLWGELSIEESSFLSEYAACVRIPSISAKQNSLMNDISKNSTIIIMGIETLFSNFGCF